MTTNPVPTTPSTTPNDRISWPVVAGLSSLALLWPLTGITGIGGTGPGRAFTIIAITAVVWIGVVGFGRVARPVATLTLTGVAFGVLALLMSLLIGGGGIGGDGGPAWFMVPALAMDAFWGFVAGLLALGVQRVLAGADR